MRLEALASTSSDTHEYPYATDGEAYDPAPMFQALKADINKGARREDMALRFHRFVAAMFSDAARSLVQMGEASAIALSGGCFQNALLLTLIRQELVDIPVLTHRTTPAGDGGLALGQALVALAPL
jgi:hydrogenase maturation protein HypF